MSKLTDEQWVRILEEDTLGNCKLLARVLQETLRLEPSARFSTGSCVKERILAGGLDILPDNMFFVSVIGSGRNPKQWIEPNKFIPERFDPNSPLYLTPDGQKRHPQAYIPFLGGKRVCLGKGFAERLVAMIIPSMIMQLNFEFLEKKFYNETPLNSFMSGTDDLQVKLTKVHK